MNKLITQFVFASALPVAIGIASPYFSRSCRLISRAFIAGVLLLGLATQAQAQTRFSLTPGEITPTSITFTWDAVGGCQ